MKPMRMKCLAILTLVAFARAGNAQTLVVPKGAGVQRDLASSEGSDSFFLPGRYAPSRVVVVYRGADLGSGAQGFAIGSIAMRRDGLRTTVYRAHKWKLTVELSTDGVVLPSGLRAESFQAAHGRDRTKVVDGQLVDWPADPRPAKPPAKFTVAVKLAKPFLLPQGRNLCVDLRSEAPSGQRESFFWYADADRYDRSAFEGTGRLLGRGCPFGFQTRINVPPLDGESRIETYSYTRFAGSSSTWAFLVVGSSNQTWGGTSLPFDLPGATGCKLYTNPVVVQVARTVAADPRGLVRFWSTPVPKLAALQGFLFYEQCLVHEPAANAIGIRASNYLEVRLGKVADPLPARLVYHSGPDLSDKPTSMIDSGIVLELAR